MFTTLASAAFVAAAGSSDITINPVVLGPLAAFVFLCFVTEVIVPGKSWKRLNDEADRRGKLNEQVVPLAENMVSSVKDMAASLDKVADMVEDVLELLDDEARQRIADYQNSPQRRRTGDRGR